VGAKSGTFRYAAIFPLIALLSGAALLGGCAATEKAARPGEPPAAEPVSVRLPVITPLKIEQTAPPPGAEQSIAPAEVQEGMAHSLKLFQVDLTPGKKGPPVDEDATGLSEPMPGD
jgi:hypothetical protein